MKRRPWWVRVLMVIGIIIAIPLVCITVVLGIFYFYPRIGRITDFRVAADGVQILQTRYVFEAQDGRLYLVNTVTGQSMRGFDGPVEYTILSHKNQLYLITRASSGGSGEAFWHNVYNITLNEPIFLNSQSEDVMAGYRCFYPRLDGDRLEFVAYVYCDGWLFLPYEPTYNYIELKSMDNPV